MSIQPVAAPIDLTGQGHYFTWSFIQISAANLVMIVLIAAVFVAALLLPFPGRRHDDD
jgi:hypothetical protein